MDIRLVRGRNHRLWLWTAVLVTAGLLVLASTLVLGDATAAKERRVGEDAGFGSDRAPVIPMLTEPFESALPLEDRELGRRLHLVGMAESGTVRNAVWVRTLNPRRWILVRVEPVPRGKAIRPFYAGTPVDVQGYLQRISRAEFDAWIDSLGVRLPRAKPGVKFGDLPDSGFIRIDSLFIRDFYISVRPEEVRGGLVDAPTPRPAARPAPRPAPPRPAAPARDPVPEDNSATAPATDITVPPAAAPQGPPAQAPPPQGTPAQAPSPQSPPAQPRPAPGQPPAPQTFPTPR
jgi:hypothetical protein